ncbi:MULTISPECIES: hypothetical protein [Paracoccus]|uniref:hypothetical protein n=1 Tax=Paracoccus TaxID=265 RepID=UPI0003B42F06|nr:MULTISPECIES: hypothetical protein [Paracoccus]
MKRLLPALILSLAPAAPALAADAVFCSARIEGQDVVLAHDPSDPNSTRRERLSAKLGRDACPAHVTLRALTPNLTEEERTPFCLREDRGDILGIDLGPRDGRGRCARPSRSVCERVNAATGAAGAITGAAARGAAAGVDRLPDGSGAVILSGGSGAISSALAAMGGAAATVAASPVLLTGAAVSVVAVGGTVYACRPD